MQTARAETCRCVLTDSTTLPDRQTDGAHTDSRHTATEHRQNRAHNDNELDSVE